ncbi:MAG: hypothetical protein GY699_06390 [Desulfobacteraceae bacterium]|nr:hypothetical protein [Desulfobacteraceae bacterium]
MKKLLLLLGVIFLLGWNQTPANADFADNFENSTFTENNWVTFDPGLLQDWDLDDGIGTPGGYHGSTLSTEPPANMAANSGQAYDLSGLHIETFFGINSSTDIERFGGVAFSLHPDNGFTASVHANEGDSNFTLEIGLINGGGDFLESTSLSSSSFSFYQLIIDVNDDQYPHIDVALFGVEIDVDGDGNEYRIISQTALGNVSYQNQLTGFDSGSVAIFGTPEVVFDDFTLTGNPVPIPGAIWLLSSGLIGLVGYRRKNAK